MKKSIPILSALVLGAALSLPAIAQTTAATPVKVMDAEAKVNVVKKSAVVTAIDMKNRIVTLKGPAGNEFSVPWWSPGSRVSANSAPMPGRRT